MWVVCCWYAEDLITAEFGQRWNCWVSWGAGCVGCASASGRVELPVTLKWVKERIENLQPWRYDGNFQLVVLQREEYELAN